MGKKNKKNIRNADSRPSLMEALGLSRITQIFQNERLLFFLGMLLFAVSCCMVVSFISFFTTGQVDVSMIENLREGELANQNGEFRNACGSIGAYTSYFFIKQCFGIPAFLVPVFIFLLSLRLMKAFKPKLLKWFMCLMLVMIWASIMLAKFASPFFSESHFCPGGDHGRLVGKWIEGFVGTPGLAALLIIIAILFLTYVSSETYEWVRKLLNPMKFLDKVKFKITNEDPTEPVDSYEKQIETDDDPLVFDDPATQTVEFKGDEVVVNAPAAADMPSKPVRKRRDQGEMDMDVKVAEGEEKADGTNLVEVGEAMLEPYDPKRDLPD